MADKKIGFTVAQWFQLGGLLVAMLGLVFTVAVYLSNAADETYARKDVVELQIKQLREYQEMTRDDLNEIKGDIKKLLRRTK